MQRRNKPACPNCEGHDVSAFGTSGWANDHTIPITRARCATCGYHGILFTGWLPDDASMTSLDDARRMRDRIYRRVQGGRFAQQRVLIDRKAKRLTSDWIELRVWIRAGKVQSGLAKRLATMKRRRAPVIQAKEVA